MNKKVGAAEPPSFAEAFRFWLKLGFISFGGPTGQIAIMQTELVENRKWISQSRFLHALNYCMLLPGPEAQQLATYIGWLLHKTWGGIVAGALFVIPSIFILWILSFVYAAYGNLPWIAAIFYGLKPAVMAIVAVAVIRIGRKALKNEVMWTLAALAFVAIFFLKVPFPFIILSAGVIGFIGGNFWKSKFNVVGGHAGGGDTSVIGDADRIAAAHAAIFAACNQSNNNMGRTLVRAAPCSRFVVRLEPHAFSTKAVFFSKAAVVTFGGAYAVLPYVAQQALFHYGWLKPGQMMDGLGLAETTPGPLIMVLQFVGFMGGWQHPQGLPPLLAATLGALLTTWATFTPCFLWIFLGGPYIEKLRGNMKLTAALSAVTAAVVGVVLNLAVWFALNALFPSGRINWFALVVFLIAFVGMLRWRWQIVPVIFGSALAGFAWQYVLRH